MSGSEFSLAAREAFSLFVRRIEHGEPADFETLCRDHPEMAGELRALARRRQMEKGTTVGHLAPVQPPSEDGAEHGFAAAILERLTAHGRTHARYRRGGEIAKGGQGAVLRVWDEDLRRPLAMKVLLGTGTPGTAESTPVEQRALTRFLEEALVTGQLDHPGIVPVHELGLDSDGRVYFTMKLVKGRTLKEVFELVASGEEGWTRTRALSILLKVCEATAYAHAKGVIHRDLKPGNVMVGRYGEVYVMDWGLARVLDAEDRLDIRIRQPGLVSEAFQFVTHPDGPSDAPLITMDGDVVGTPSYMAPEQALGRLDQIGAHSDVYSTGAMLYHLLAGHAPYVEPGMLVSNYDVWYQVQKGPPSALNWQAPDLPAELVAICEKAMARDWRARYRDTSELGEDLAAFLDDHVVRAYRTGAVAELGKWIVRNKGLASALAAALLAVLVGLVASVLLKARADHNAQLAEERRIDGEKRRDEVLRLSEQADLEVLVSGADALWPASPERIDAYLDWMERARTLIAELPSLRSEREQRRAKALPRSEPERELDRRSHPEYPELQRVAARRAAVLQRARGVRVPLPELDGSTYPSDARRLGELAWERVDPARQRFGEEALGLALALRGRALAPDDPDLARTTAWAYFALGRDDEALDTGDAAVASAPQARKEQFESALAELDAAVAAAADGLASADAELAALATRLEELGTRVDERRTWRFPGEERGGSWWNDQLTRLIAGLESLERGLYADDVATSDHGWSIPRRLRFARLLQQGFAPGGLYARAWQEALPAIRAAYPGLGAEVLLGLVPLGPDPRSGFWEFAHLQTGEVPARDARGEIVLSEESGLVFVLLPGGTFVMGAQARDPRAPNFDRFASSDEEPVREVALSAFLMSKYEMTQGQWQRFTGRNPSLHAPGAGSGLQTLLDPVEMVSWHDSAEVMSRLGLVLPTEAQWEYAARAGTTTPWWTGRERESLRRTVNIADQALRRAGSPYFTPDDWPDLDDGFSVHAPVNAFDPNPFALYGVLGNVYEWCRDENASYASPPGTRDGERRGLRDHRMYRGGGFIDIAAHARASYRSAGVPEYRGDALGLRPARMAW